MKLKEIRVINDGSGNYEYVIINGSVEYDGTCDLIKKIFDNLEQAVEFVRVNFGEQDAENMRRYKSFRWL